MSLILVLVSTRRMNVGSSSGKALFAYAMIDYFVYKIALFG